jgi:hypothetical protein
MSFPDKHFSVLPYNISTIILSLTCLCQSSECWIAGKESYLSIPNINLVNRDFVNVYIEELKKTTR